MAITTGGMSGIDINGLVSQLMSIERQPLQKMTVKEVGLQAKISAYGTIKSGLTSFQSALAKLNNVATYTGSTSATSSDDSAVKISASAGAQASKYNIEVTQLATSQKLASRTYTKASDVIGEGVLTIDFGSYGSGFTPNTARTSISVTIDSTNNTLEGVRDAINKANGGVSASIVNDGTGYRLALSSSQSGSANNMRITVAEAGISASNTDLNGLSALAYNPAATPAAITNMTQNQAAKDSIFKLDGITITKPTNVVTDAIDGLTFTLAKETTTQVQLSVNKNSASITAPLKEMVKSYNDLIKTMRDLTKADTSKAAPGESNNAQVLNGEYVPRMIETELRDMMNQVLDYTGGDIKRLSQVGISVDRNGVMTLDETKLNKGMADDPDGVTSLFASNARSTDRQIKIETLGKNTLAGNYDLNVTALASQGTFVGSTAATFTSGVFPINSTNKSISLTVDGKAISIDLAEGSYTSTQLAAEIQTRVNSNSTLKTAGSTVAVSIDASNKISITSNKYGASSSVMVSSAAAEFGLQGGTNSSGVDAAGSLNGIALKSDGQKLYNDDGFKLSVLGGTIGDRGGIAVSQGFASQLDKAVAKIIDGKGAIGTKLETLNKTVKDIQQQRTAFERRMTATEARYRAQYVALDTMLTQMQQTSSSLSQQLATLPKFS
ncbi:flagellar filament capping protein FliD [Chitinibacter fontanus]|uniref:Flagellar hook-associated protein 2 n=1 Tax=Chitinibacter fontanus TaxID=1737446 RepID=A0A7D5ZE01_9NEIS|nr:flagellar filament capping protein FliD [Chitinibacter fontanus]QLI80127.1 flagellar filament capping protein FliD [Chitinibacter fontanus]